jgi:hypothetical protein
MLQTRQFRANNVDVLTALYTRRIQELQAEGNPN